MSATERDDKQPSEPSVISMRDLLAACAAATVVSTPPPAPQPEAA
ncbi:hypothetical protein ACIQ6Y_30245 [Streptomyces sp. NPDC096205]